MNLNMINGLSSVALGAESLNSSRMNEDNVKFADLIESLSKNADFEKKSTLSSNEIIESGRLNGDFSTGFSGTYTNKNDKESLAQGAAANQSNPHVSQGKIDKTSKLYEKSMELESYFVKQMLSAMRKTVSKSPLGGNDFAGQMYEDMLYDEYATSMTKNAGFGLADQIYLSLVK